MTAPTSSVSEADVRRAFGAKADYIFANRETISMKAARALLEGELLLESGGLSEHKQFVKQLVTNMIESAGGEGGAGESEVAKKVEQRRQRSGETRTKERKPKVAPKAAVPSGGAYSKKVEKLKKICQAATITVPPIVYKGKEDEIVRERLEQLLEKHGLHSASTPSDIKRAKKTLQQQRDLEGMDVSNILEGRPRRGAAMAAVTNVRRYTTKAVDSDDEDDTPIKQRAFASATEEEQEDEESDDDEAARDKDRGRKRKANAVDGGSGSEEDGEEGTEGREGSYARKLGPPCAEEGSGGECDDEGDKNDAEEGVNDELVGEDDEVVTKGRRRGAVCIDSSDEESE